MQSLEASSEKPPIIYHHNGWDTKLIPSENGTYFLVGIERGRIVKLTTPEPGGLLGRIGVAIRVIRASMPIL